MGLLPQPLSREAVTLLSASFYRLWKKQPGHVAGGPGGSVLGVRPKMEYLPWMGSRLSLQKRGDASDTKLGLAKTL